MTNDQIVESKAFIWSCGNNKDGQLGLGNEEKKMVPTNVSQLNGFPVKEFCASNTHSALLTPSSDIHVAGSCLHGKMGMVGIQKKFLNKFHVVTQLELHKVKQMAVSDYVTLVLLETGDCFQLGGSNMMDSKSAPNDTNEACGVPGLEGLNIVQVDCGDQHAAAVDSDGNLYTWGGGKTT